MDRTTIRLLECWLPLAQEVSQRNGWYLDATELEALIIQARDLLSAAHSVEEARVILWHCQLSTRIYRRPANEDAPPHG